MNLRFHLALDSGAFSVFRKYLTKSGKTGATGPNNVSVKALLHKDLDKSYYTSDAYHEYVDEYVSYVKQNQHALDFYVTLDMISDPVATWDSTMKLEKLGLKPIPVFHFGEDYKWLKKYMDRCEHIGIGGLGQNASMRSYLAWVTKAFAMLSDSKGRPKWKTHGFAMTAWPLLTRFPWSTVDSSSALSFARWGALCVPKPIHRNGKIHSFDFAGSPFPLPISTRRKAQGTSYWRVPQADRDAFKEYITNHLGTTVKALQTYAERDMANAYFYSRVGEVISEQRKEKYGREWPLHVYLSGKPGSGEKEFVANFPRLAALGLKDLYYLGSYFLPNPTTYFINQGLYKGSHHEKGRPRIRAEASPAVHHADGVHASSRPLLLRR